MLKIVVIQPGEPDREVLVPGDSATIGRVAPCDVVVDRPFVSKQHLRILHGTVAVDLGSSNGTFVGGRRMTEAVLLEGRTLALGQQGVELRIEAPSDASGEALDGDLESLRSQIVLLEAEVSELKRELAAARGGAGEKEALLGRLKGENESLRERVESLKAELVGRVDDDAESVQARLAMQRVESVQELNEKLQIEVERLKEELAERAAAEGSAEAVPEVRAEVATPDDGERARLRAECARLEAALAAEKAAARAHEEQATLVRKLRKELEAVRAAGASAAPPPDLARALERGQAEAQELRARVAELEGRLAEAAPAPEQNVSDLFFKLRAENNDLRRKVAALEKAGGGAGAGAPAPAGGKAGQVKELMEARMRIAALEAELAKSEKTPRAAPPVPAARVPEAVPASAARPAGACDVRALLRAFAQSDVEGLPRAAKGAVEEFVLVESLRLLRQVERVVTRVAGDLIQLFRLQTMLPETSGTYREIVAALLDERPGSGARDELAEYLEKLGRWLVASIGAHRKAAVLAVARIKEDLSEKSLVARDPLPPYARVPMLAGNELWRRAQDYLATLSPDTIDERVEALAREQAQVLLNEGG